MALADLVDLGLDGLSIGAGGQRRERLGQVFQRRGFHLIGRPVGLAGLHEVPVVRNGGADQPIEDGRALGRGLCVVAGDEPPQHVLVLGVADARQVQKDGIGEMRFGPGRRAAVDMEGRVLEKLGGLVLGGELLEVAEVVVDAARDHVEMKPFRLARGIVHEKREAFGRRVGQPFLHRQAIAAGFRDLLAVLIQEQFVGHALGWAAAEDAADLRGQGHRIDQVLARHLIIDAERHPAHGPVDLPLQLAIRTPHLDLVGLVVGVAVDQGTVLQVTLDHRHLEHPPGRRTDRQERRIGRPPLFAQGRQDHRHDRVVML